MRARTKTGMIWGLSAKRPLNDEVQSCNNQRQNDQVTIPVRSPLKPGCRVGKLSFALSIAKRIRTGLKTLSLGSSQKVVAGEGFEPLDLQVTSLTFSSRPHSRRSLSCVSSWKSSLHLAGLECRRLVLHESVDRLTVDEPNSALSPFL